MKKEEKECIHKKILQKRLVNKQIWYLVEEEINEDLKKTWTQRDQIDPQELKILENSFIDNSLKKEKSSSHKKLNFKSETTHQLSIDSMYGDLESGDIPKKILKSRKIQKTIEFIIEWDKRENGFKPKNSVVTNKEMKKYCPEVLLKFYEDNIVFIDK